jgi:thiosulfate dehydrogenase
MIRLSYSIVVLLLINTVLWAQDSLDHSPAKYERKDFTEDMRVSRGGQLYDNWWKVTVDAEKPAEDQPLWKTQNTNKRNGYSTYRCKECHGWDYKGRDGAYGKGSHYTGFKGVYKASKRKSVKDLEGLLKGSIKEHDFSGQLSENDISDLSLFIKYGIIDLVEFINSDGSPVGGDIRAGQNFFATNCMTECHGPDGMAIDFGDEKKPGFIGTVANMNPWEFIHKVRAGQPGTRMSSGIINKWSNEDIRNLLTYSRTLPKELPVVGWFDRIMGTLGIWKKKQESHISKEHRGFGPKIEQLNY